MALQYLSGIGAAKKTKVQKVQAKQATKTAKIQAKTAQVQAKQQLTAAKTQAKQAKTAAKVVNRGQKQQLQQTNRQTLITKSTPVKVLKAVAKQSPLAAQKIKKAAVVQKQRSAFKKAGEPLAIEPETLQAEETYELPLTLEEGTEEVNESEFTNDMDSEDMPEDNYDEMGIIYPSFGAPKKSVAKKTAAKKAPVKKTAAAKKAPVKKTADPAKKAKRQEITKKLSSQILNVAKATLEAKGIKFPSKEQIETEAQTISPVEKPKTNYTPIIIGAGALGFLLFLENNT